MGLSIRYTLELSGSSPSEAVFETLRRLQLAALDMSVAGVSPLFSPSLRSLLAGASQIDADLERSFHRAASLNLYDVAVALERVEHRGRRAAAGFSVHPGRGCASAPIGFMRPGLTAAPEHADADVPWDRWWWQGSCVTQYASVVSTAHLIKCHLAVVHLLDEAERLGVLVTVCDETEYWETRSVQHLLQEVDRANGIMARLL